MSNVHRLQNAPKLKLGQVLRAELARLGLSQQKFATENGLSRPTVNNLINSKYPASRPVAKKLAIATRRSEEFWLRTEFTERDLIPPEVAQNTSAAEAGRILGRLGKEDIVRLVEAGELEITPFDKRFVEPTSIDLRCGDFIETASGDRIDVSDQPYFLMPGETMRLDTLETLKMPYNIVGSIAGMGRHVKRFIVYGIGDEVDLGFDGQLGFTVTNMGIEGFRIAAGMEIITARFYLMASKSETEYPGTPSPQRLPNPSQAGGLAKAIRDAMEAAYQTTVRAGVVEHSLIGTDFGFKARAEIEPKNRLPLFLNEIEEMQNRLAREYEERRARIEQNDDTEIDGSENSECDSIWEFLGAIEITTGDLHASLSLLQPLIDKAGDHHMESLAELIKDGGPSDTITIAELDDRAGLSPFDVVLQAFKRRG